MAGCWDAQTVMDKENNEGPAGGGRSLWDLRAEGGRPRFGPRETKGTVSTSVAY